MTTGRAPPLVSSCESGLLREAEFFYSEMRRILHTCMGHWHRSIEASTVVCFFINRYMHLKVKGSRNMPLAGLKSS